MVDCAAAVFAGGAEQNELIKQFLCIGIFVKNMQRIYILVSAEAVPLQQLFSITDNSEVC